MQVDTMSENIEDLSRGVFITSETCKPESVCRLCLGNKATLDIFSTDSSFLSIVMNLCSLNIYQNDGLPSSVCENCVKMLQCIENFKKQCIASDIALRNKNPESLNYFLKTEADFDNDDKNDIYDFPVGSCTSLVIDEVNIKCEVVKEKKKSFKTKKKRHHDSKKVKLTKKKDFTSSSRSLLCPICGKIFSAKASLKAHLLTHNDEKLFSCEICSKRFRNKSQLNLHSATHITSRDHSCETCGKTFKTKIAVNKHMKIIHKRLRKATCEICGLEMATHYSLKMHLRIHTGAKNFECDICKMKFTYKNSLTLHRRVHTGEKPYNCRYCDGKFSMHRSWKDHERLHTGETPYQCPACPKAFSQLSNMKSHFKNNHKDLDFDKLYKGLRKKKYNND